MSSSTLTKLELSDKLNKQIGISRRDCSEIVEVVLDLVVENLAEDNTVKIRSFGSFYARQKRERIGRNPKTGISSMISPRRVVIFRASSILKNRINASLDLLKPKKQQ